MIRTELLPLTVLRSPEPTFRNVYGFGWNPWAPENKVTALAVIRVELEYHDGTHGTLTLRSGVWYSGKVRIDRAWVTSTVPGDAVFDLAYSEGESAMASPVSNGQTVTEEATESALAQNFGTTPYVSTFGVPSWARRGDIWMKVGGIATGLGGTWQMVDRADFATVANPLNAPATNTYVRIIGLGADGVPAGVGAFDVGPNAKQQPGPLPAKVIVTLNGGSMAAGQTVRTLARWGA